VPLREVLAHPGDAVAGDVEDGLHRRPRHRAAVAEDGVEARPEGEDVGPRADAGEVSRRLLRRHEPGRAEDVAAPRRRAGHQLRRGEGLAVDPVGRAVLLGQEELPLVLDAGVAGQDDARRVAEALGDPPVHHLHLTELADHDVVRLEVPVDDAAAVGVGHRLARRLEGVDDPVEREAAVLARRPGAALDPGVQGTDDLLEGPAADQAHREPEAPPGAALVEDRGDPGVAQPSHDLRLEEEALPERGVEGVLPGEDLQGELALEAGVPDQTDLAHAALADAAPVEVAGPRRGAAPFPSVVQRRHGFPHTVPPRRPDGQSPPSRDRHSSGADAFRTRPRPLRLTPRRPERARVAKGSGAPPPSGAAAPSGCGRWRARRATPTPPCSPRCA
jgi:hypothetical protein